MFELGHVSLVVSDCEKSAAFYSTCLGFSIRKRAATDRFKVIFVRSGSLVLELMEYLHPEASPRTRGVYDHLAFRVDDLAGVIVKLQAHGVIFESEHPRLAFDGSQIIFFHGPDGERIELVGI